MNVACYNQIGAGYAQYRVADARIASYIDEALGDAVSVVNVGAGTGSYEPQERLVVAVEPSTVMAKQRHEKMAPAVIGVAEALPLVDNAVDAAMAVLTVHHWSDVVQGLREMMRVARKRVVILTVDSTVSSKMWLLRDYLPEIAELDQKIFPAMGQFEQLLGATQITTIPIPQDCTDWFLMSFWAHPERVLDSAARGATSGFARLSKEQNDRVVEKIAADLASGLWDQRYGELRTYHEYDAGLRLVVAQLSDR